MRPRRGRNADGFALLEVIIAFLVLSLTLTVTIQVISRGAGTISRSVELDGAMLVMDRLASGVLNRLAGPGQLTGRTGSVDWTIDAHEVRDAHPGALLAVDIRIMPGGEDGSDYRFQMLTAPGDGR